MMERYERLFYYPESFINLDGKIFCYPRDSEEIIRIVCRKMGLVIDPNPNYDAAIERMKEFYPRNSDSENK